ncbi:MAG: DUF3696 domain-containing protein [Acidobacteria bacterium]|nr:DUF3696 domain-containing protein [Acidobacteriota bacterium]
MNEIFFEGVRCFHDPQSCLIKPITLLVGENSSGKTTFLALNRIAWDIAEGNLIEDFFNEEPFLLGSYDQIASYGGGRAGRVKSFVIGIQVQVRLKANASQLFADHARISARFGPLGLDQWTFECGKFSIVAKQEAKSPRLDVTVKTPRGTLAGEDMRFAFPFGISRLLPIFSYFLSGRFPKSVETSEQQKVILSGAESEELRNISVQLSRSLGPRPFAFAPIRTRPLRTYNPLKEVPKPEGSHVPMVLAKTFLDKSEGSERLRDALVSFGKSSGLFKDVEVKRKGRKESDPFQIGIKTIGPAVNLVDVGYGVSQVLPIIVDVFQYPEASSFLLQQPEVHLHPKAQAELASFLASLAKTQGKRFVIETHSDYLIDRIRMDIRDKKGISRDDVAILYFERSRTGPTIHSLDIDENGNITNAPPTYRQFFLQEERRMLGM